MKICVDFAPNFGDMMNWLLHHDNTPSHASFSPENFRQKQHDSRPQPTTLFSVSPVEGEMEGCHFDTIEVIEAESQAVLNTLTEHNLKDPFTKWKKRWEWCIRIEGVYFEGDGGH
jgi:hypothetical protein